MTRNLDFRCEVAVPIYDKEIQKQLKSILSIQLSGNTKARILDEYLTNTYKKPGRNQRKIRAQDEIYHYFFNEKQAYLKKNKSI